MFGLGTGTGIIFFEVVGVCLVLVIIWIIKSEKRREIYGSEIVRLKRQLEAQERERSMLVDRLEDADGTIQEMEESAPAQMKEQVEGMSARLKDLEGENERLCEELTEAKESLEEVYRAVHEEV